MKIFKGRTTEVRCPGCGAWVRLQSVRLSHFTEPKKFIDDKSTSEFKRVYECPRCQASILRCPK